MKSRHKWIAGIIVIGCAVAAMSLLTLGDYAVYYYLPHEAIANAQKVQDQDIRLGGMVKAGSVDWKPEDLTLAFVVTDFEGSDIQVRHKGTPPDMFKEGQGVVVEGRLDPSGRQMTSKLLFVKHSEEYQKPDAEHSLDHELLKKSLFK
ncbi:MAG: cytochrome c maturation protein CcmE [Oligoflexales bacterium]